MTSIEFDSSLRKLRNAAVQLDQFATTWATDGDPIHHPTHSQACWDAGSAIQNLYGITPIDDYAQAVSQDNPHPFTEKQIFYDSMRRVIYPRYGNTLLPTDPRIRERYTAIAENSANRAALVIEAGRYEIRERAEGCRLIAAEFEQQSPTPSADKPNIADLALEAIQQASPAWITAAEIGKTINKEGASIRAALSRAFRGIDNKPYTSETGGQQLGYRWND